ncbi:MAG: RNA methyltransferase [Chloracidobacterium sp.]|nr:RNA methyltransferase [Chloracidobacterium sp.]
MREIEKITSSDNRRLVNARKVRDGKVPEQIFIEGRRLVEEVLRSNLVIDDCFVTDDFADDELFEMIAALNIAIAVIPNRLLDSLSDTKHPQGIIMIAKRPETSLSAIETNLGNSLLSIVVFLKEINNPSNLGAILRTAEAAGVAGVIISSNSANVFSPKSLRAAMGSAFRLPIVENTDIENTLHWSKSTQLTSTAAAGNSLKNYADIDWRKPRLLIFGSEAHGLDNAELQLIEDAIRIPMENEVESLNLAVSAGVLLFEAKRQITS